MELKILEFDHLDESEQRERGILGENDKYIPKAGRVGEFESLESAEFEAKKCQLVCKECHVIETIRRDKEKSDHEDTNRENTEKRIFYNNIRMQGCSICGYKNNKLLRFIELDHLDPSAKIDNVSTISHKSEYTIEDLKIECGKCRVLCGFCHKIETHNQLK